MKQLQTSHTKAHKKSIKCTAARFDFFVTLFYLRRGAECLDADADTIDKGPQFE